MNAIVDFRVHFIIKFDCVIVLSSAYPQNKSKL